MKSQQNKEENEEKRGESCGKYWKQKAGSSVELKNMYFGKPLKIKLLKMSF